MEKETLLEGYGVYLLEHQSRPKSMYHFAQHLKIDEQNIYAHFASFDSMESAIMGQFVENARDLALQQAAEDDAFKEQRAQLLTFYLTLVEVMKANRSLTLLLLPKGKDQLQAWKNLKSAKHIFLEYINTLGITIEALSFIPSDTVKDKALEVTAWGQFLSILGFWIKDDSADFERTDIFIEKNLKLSFDIADSNIIQSIVDLGKFTMRHEKT